MDSVFSYKLEDTEIGRMYRFGRWSGDEQVDRPLLVSFKDVELKNQVMTNIRDLRLAGGRFKGIGISPDRPPKDERK